MVSINSDAKAFGGLSGAGNPPEAEPSEPKPESTEERLRSLELLSITGTDGTAKNSLWGLALSGGGIRSATFALGVLQSLAQKGWLPAFHYLSTVSGGGYVGAYLQAMMRNQGLDVAMAKLAPSSDSQVNLNKPRKQTGATAEAVLALRKHSNFLSPQNGPLSPDRLSMLSGFATNFVFVQLMLLPLLLTISFLVSVVYRLLLATWTAPSLPSLVGPLILLCIALWYRRIPKETVSGPNKSKNVSISREETIKQTERANLRTLLIVGAAISTLIMVSLTIWPPVAFGARITPQLSDLWSLAPTLILVSIAFLYWMHRNDAKDQLTPRTYGTIGGLAFGLVILVACLHFIQQIPMWHSKAFLLPALSAGTLLVYLAFFVAGSIAFGVSSLAERRVATASGTTTSSAPAHSNLASTAGSYVLSHEWAQFAGICALGVVCVAVIPFVLVSTPAAIEASLRGDVSRPRTLVILAILILTPILGAVLLRSIQGKSNTLHGRILIHVRDAASKIAPWAMILFIALLISWISQEIMQLLVGRPGNCGTENIVESFRCQSEILKKLTGAMWAGLIFSYAIISLIWYLVARGLNENDFSMNAFYRNRLVSCYLAPANENRKATRIDPQDDFSLGSLLRSVQKEERPLYPLICCAVNLTTGKHLDWQDRKAASFILSPLYCGHVSPRNPSLDASDRRNQAGDAYDIGDTLPKKATKRSQLRASELAEQTTLGTAVSVSGAAVSPNMGHYSSRAVGFLLTLFNARLGWWIPNLRAENARDYGLNIISEMLGDAGGADKYAHISDGGHFENLGVYELIRRRCRFIMCVDASADPSRDFEGLGNAIHKCRVDFGAEIDIDITAIKPNVSTGFSAQRAALGKISYDDGTTGYLLYLKPCLMGDEPPDISNYASSQSSFPHEPTSDQFFDERQFEAYRHLGFVSGQQLLTEALISRPSSKIAGAPADEFNASNPVKLNDNVPKEAFLLELRHRFYEPSDAISLHFSRHGEALEKLYRTLRKNTSLKEMDPYLFPGWPGAKPNLSATASSAAGPLSPNFRDCFYFAQEQIQLMEAVYVDLELEHNHRHPDNRGWINMFRQWAWAPAFRIAWALSAQTRGARFVRFCESRLRIPSIVDATTIHWEYGAGHAELLRTADALWKSNDLNEVEYELLRSRVVSDLFGAALSWKVGVLQVQWNALVSAGANSLPEKLGVGLALATVKTSKSCIRVLRVQDHLRCLGLGRAFTAKVLEEIKKPMVRIAAGQYGLIGELSAEAAHKQTDRLNRMISDAR